MKTPEEMAEEWADLCVSDAYYAPLKAGFLAGYQAAMDQVADADKVINSPEKPDGWISVKDRLPELGEEVLVLGNEGSLEVRRLTLRKIRPDEKDPHYWLDGWDESADYTVTHWMEIPEPPKEEK